MPKRNASRGNRSPDAGLDVTFRASDEDLAELDQLIGERIARVVVWEDSVIDALADSAPMDAAADMDVYLENGVRFELYAVLCYASLEEEPYESVHELSARFDAMTEARLELADVAVDTEDDLVLVLAAGESALYLNVGAWTLDEWEELPE